MKGDDDARIRVIKQPIYKFLTGEKLTDHDYRLLQRTLIVLAMTIRLKGVFDEICGHVDESIASAKSEAEVKQWMHLLIACVALVHAEDEASKTNYNQQELN